MTAFEDEHGTYIMRLFARLSLDSALPDRTTIMNSDKHFKVISISAFCTVHGSDGRGESPAQACRP